MNLFRREKVVNRVVLVPVSQIVPNPAQPRKVFDPDQLAALAESIRENGLLQPVTLRRVAGGPEEKFELVAGERRFLACKGLKMREIPAIIQEISENDSAVMALIENIQRSDLNYFEEAAAIQGLITKWKITQEEAARRLGKSQSAIANKLRLLKFNNYTREEMLRNGLTERHARALLKVQNESILENAILYIAENDLNVAETEKYVESLGKEKGTGKRGSSLLVVKDLRIFLNTISKAMDTMKMAGIEASSSTKEDEEYIEYIVKIPKKSAYQKRTKIKQ